MRKETVLARISSGREAEHSLDVRLGTVFTRRDVPESVCLHVCYPITKRLEIQAQNKFCPPE